MLKQYLLHARELIDKHGWVQGVYGNPEKGFCIIGAISRACWDDGVTFETQTAMEGDLQRHAPGYESLVAFNDAKGRTKEEVLALFDRAIQEAT